MVGLSWSVHSPGVDIQSFKTKAIKQLVEQLCGMVHGWQRRCAHQISFSLHPGGSLQVA